MSNLYTKVTTRTGTMTYDSGVICFTRKDLLMTDPFCPISYNIKLSKAPKSNLLLRLTVACSLSVDVSIFEISPNVLSFDSHNFDVFQKVQISVNIETQLDFLSLLAEQYQVVHSIISPEDAFKNHEKSLKLYCINTTGKNLIGCGNDDYFQVGLQESTYRFKAYRNYSTMTLTRPIKSNVPKFEPTSFPKEDSLTEFNRIDMGKHHTVALTAEGKVYVWGTGYYGQLGISTKVIAMNQAVIFDESLKEVDYDFDRTEVTEDDILIEQDGFCPIVYLPIQIKLKVLIASVACGDYHTLLLDCSGSIHSIGLAANGRLGLHSQQKRNVETAKKIPIDVKFARIACTAHSSMAIDNSGKLYTWGCEDDGVLGHSLGEDIWFPTKIKVLDKVHSIYTGPKTCACLDYHGKMYVWGLFIGEKIVTPKLWEPFSGNEEINIRQIALGQSHFGILTDDLNVYTWGSNEFGQLGLGIENQLVKTPTLVTGLCKMGICYLSFGDHHSLAINMQGLLYSWGRNNRSQLGLHNCTQENIAYSEKIQEDNITEKCVKFPKIVEDLLGHPVTFAKAKYKTTLCIGMDPIYGENEAEYLDKWKGIILRTENKNLYVKPKERSPSPPIKRSIIMDTRDSKSLQRIRGKDSKYLDDSEPITTARQHDDSEHLHYYDVGKNSPIIHQLLGYDRCTVFDNRYQVRKSGEPKHEAVVIKEVGIHQGISDEILSHNANLYPNVKFLFSGTIQRRKKPLYDILIQDEYDELNKIIETQTRKSPFFLS